MKSLKKLPARLIAYSLCVLLLAMPSCLRAEAKYIFFLHNMFLESHEIGDKHPEYGRVEYAEVIAGFEQAGFTVISEKRAHHTDAKAYAAKVAAQIDSLLLKGVKPSHITVIGTSKGGFIAQYVSSMVKNRHVSYVFIGACNGNTVSDVVYYGNILSIYEAGDTESCNEMKEKAGQNVSRYKEIVLRTGLKHGYLFKASGDWMKPAIAWAKGEK